MSPQSSSVPGFVGIQALKRKQSMHLAKLKVLAQQGHWEHLQTHTGHPDSGFDWWMFPIDRPSLGQGSSYEVTKYDVEVLKGDSEFMNNYREGVIIIAKSWGWDLAHHRDISSEKQRWTGYQVRLGKMLHSLKLFGQKDLHDSLRRFVEENKLVDSLESWILQYLHSE